MGHMAVPCSVVAGGSSGSRAGPQTRYRVAPNPPIAAVAADSQGLRVAPSPYRNDARRAAASFLPKVRSTAMADRCLTRGRALPSSQL